jgi:hypothetical protein
MGLKYDYLEIKPQLFEEHNQKQFLRVRDWINKSLDKTGAFQLQRATEQNYGDCWITIASIDRLQEIGEIKEVKQTENVLYSERIFIRK